MESNMKSSRESLRLSKVGAGIGALVLSVTALLFAVPVLSQSPSDKPETKSAPTQASTDKPMPKKEKKRKTDKASKMRSLLKKL